MTYIVYADIVLLWSVLINIPVYYITNKLLGFSIHIHKIVIWSLITSLILEIEYIATTGINKIMQGFSYILFYFLFLLMYVRLILKVKIQKSTITRLMVANIMANAFMAGLITATVKEYILIKIVPVFIILCILLPKIFAIFKSCNNSRSHCYEIILITSSNSIDTVGFYDTGNTLRDYSKSKPVVILDYSLLNKILSKKDYEVIEKYHQTGIFDYEKLPAIDQERVFPLPYSTISNSFSVMPAFKLNELKYKKYDISYTGIIAAISKNKLKNNMDYEVLLNESIKPNREEYSND